MKIPREPTRRNALFAKGALSQKMALEVEGTLVKGEFLRIGTAVNVMVDQLSALPGG